MRYGVLLRAVNVGRHNRVRMDILRAALTSAGLGNVRSSLQTGNLTVDADDRAAGEVAAAVESVMAELGLVRPCAIVRPWSDIAELATTTPFVGYDIGDHALTVSFCRAEIPDLPTGSWEEGGLTFLGGPPWALFAVLSRDVMGVSNANAIIERRWGIPATTRSWNVITDWVAREAPFA